MAVLGPGIGKVQINALHFARGKQLRDPGRVKTDEIQVGQRAQVHLLDSPVQHAGVALNTKIVDLGMGGGQLHEKLSFSHSDLDVEGLVFWKTAVPLPRECLRFLYTIFTVGDGFLCAGNVPESHKFSLSFEKIFPCRGNMHIVYYIFCKKKRKS